MGKKVQPIEFLLLLFLMIVLTMIVGYYLGSYLGVDYPNYLALFSALFLVSMLSFVLILGVTGNVDANILWFLALSVLTIWAYQTIAYVDQLQMGYTEGFLLNTVIDSVIILAFDFVLLLMLPKFRTRIRRMI